MAVCKEGKLLLLNENIEAFLESHEASDSGECKCLKAICILLWFLPPSHFREFMSSEFALHAGYIGIAEENGIIILYPQARNSTVPFNPKGCWDW